MQGMKELRKRKGLTQVQAAVFCHVSLFIWQLWERGVVTTPTEENQAKIRDLENLPDKK